jgi:hypothetical protein
MGPGLAALVSAVSSTGPALDAGTIRTIPKPAAIADTLRPLQSVRTLRLRLLQELPSGSRLDWLAA